MKTIGLIGGMSWESTALYYEWLNNGIKNRLGGLHSARIALYSVNFEEIEKLQHQGDWDALGNILANAARNVEAGGADFLLICTNTMHKVALAVESAITIPLLHIADPTGQELQKKSKTRPALLGTDFTMSQLFYKQRLLDEFGIECMIPEPEERKIIHRIIYEELCLGTIKSESREEYKKIIQRMMQDGADSVILGCTEITLLIKQEDVDLEVFDTTALHASAAVDFSLS